MFTFKNYFNETEFKVLSVVTRKGIIFWDVTPCHSVKLHWCFRKLLSPSTELKRKQSKSHQESRGKQNSWLHVHLYILSRVGCITLQITSCHIWYGDFIPLAPSDCYNSSGYSFLSNSIFNPQYSLQLNSATTIPIPLISATTTL